ncbi:MAG TPA: transcription-repair coupling factor [Abditibacteriaceae bacterium]|nr:transcription-repair coupling factor [Abditibacteriaceae bacterium]
MHLLDLIASHPSLCEVGEVIQAAPSLALLSGVPSAAWGVVTADAQHRSGRTVLLITPNTELAEHCANDLEALFAQESEHVPEVLLFPIPDRTSLEEFAGDSRATQDRLVVLEALHGDKPVVVVAPVNALAHPTLPPDELRQGYDEVVVGQTLDREAFIAHLAEAGYERVEQVEAPGQFAARGGIVDFFPPAAKTALRLELFGDEVDSLRRIDATTQRSTEKITSLRLTPPREAHLTLERGQAVAARLQEFLDEQTSALKKQGRVAEAESLEAIASRDIARLEQAVYFSGLERYRALLYPERPTLLEHLPPDAIVMWADPDRAHSQVARLIDDDAEIRDAAIESATALRLPEPPLCSFETLRDRTRQYSCIDLHVAPEVPITHDSSLITHHLDIHLPPAFGNRLEGVLAWIKQRQDRGGIVVLSTAHARRVREILADAEVRHVHLLDAVNQIQPSLVLLMAQRLTGGFTIEELSFDASITPQPSSLAVLTDTEIFGWQSVQPRVPLKAKQRAKPKFASKKSTALTDASDLKEGDFVVHINHGIARYAGIVRQEVAGAVNEYLLLHYGDKDRLYVPVGQLDRVQKYLGAEASPPPLNQLKGGEWERTKKRVREEAAVVAKQLAALYAARENAEKEPVAPDTPWQREMESAFPYEETEGQLQAIKDTKGDLETEKPMDRLICGDVGYGKTEVAVRAAFKVVQSGKQVVILVPTTVLAQQHYQTFSERLAPYPVRVDVLSRFRTPGEQKKVVEDLRLGAVDIMIGTHRLIQKDVKFHDLGLVVVDEEQRFGVLQKERLKELRREVDILTLSATPIPRTLQFALGGLREISLIGDPPQGRLPVRTFVMPYNEALMRQALERELEREGQVYYVHNRISSIAHIAERLHKLVPHARIGIGHGQMADEELEQVMLDFMHHRTDILLSTTIIENGLDLPNVNTLIVDRAELLGLSQMYQLRGRVGRSTRQAYAYFFGGARGKTGEAAENRFAAIQEYTDLGAGFKIAMRDLEIRGAGDLLGVKQSGSIASVGFEMYTEMLSDAVRRLRHEPIVRREELPEADLPVAAYLPPEYVTQERDRLNLYRKMANMTSLEEARSLQDELRDRFGPLPVPAFNLVRVLKIRVHLLHARLRGISKTESEVLIRLKPGDRFADEDTAAVYAKLRGAHDRRTLQHISLRPLEGLAVDSRALPPVQLLRMIEEICEVLATVRGPRFLQ